MTNPSKNQRVLTLSLTGATSKETVTNVVKIDVTTSSWNLLFHQQAWRRNSLLPGLENETIGIMVNNQASFQHKSNQRILKEMLRFASKDENVIRLLRILSLKQTEAVIKTPLTFKKLVDSTPVDFFVPIWYGGTKESRQLLVQSVKSMPF